MTPILSGFSSENSLPGRLISYTKKFAKRDGRRSNFGVKENSTANCSKKLREGLEGVPSHRDALDNFLDLCETMRGAFRSRVCQHVCLKSKMKTQRDSINCSTRYPSSNARGDSSLWKRINNPSVPASQVTGHSCNPSHIIIREIFRR